MGHHRPLQLEPLSQASKVDCGADQEGHRDVDNAAVLAQKVHLVEDKSVERNIKKRGRKGFTDVRQNTLLSLSSMARQAKA